MTAARLQHNQSVSFNWSVIGLLVFGGKDNITRSQGYKDAFAREFSPDHKKGGAAPSTRAWCLTHNMVCHNSKDDPKYAVYRKI